MAASARAGVLAAVLLGVVVASGVVCVSATESSEPVSAEGVELNFRLLDSMRALEIEPDVVEKLLAEGADPNAEDDDGVSALMIAAELGKVEWVQALLKAGADVNHKSSKNSKTPLMSAVSKGAIGDVAVVEALLEAGADVHAVDKFHQSALTHAATRGIDTLILRLAGAGADLEVVDKHGATPLLMAAAMGKSKAVDALITAGANKDVVDAFGRSPLIVAAYSGGQRAVRSLLAAGADVHATDNDGDRAVDYAEREGHDQVARILKRHAGEYVEEDHDSEDYWADDAVVSDDEVEAEL